MENVTQILKQYESEKDVSFLDDISDIELAKDCLISVSNPEFEENRDTLLFISSTLTANNQFETNLTQSLINQLDLLKKENELTSLLTGLGNGVIAKEVDIDPLLKKTKYKNGFVRGLAILALGKCEQDVESILIDIIKKPKNKSDLWYTIVSLGRVGTPSSLEFLKPYLKSRKPDLKESAIVAYSLILIRQNTPIDQIHKITRAPIIQINTLTERIKLLSKATRS